MILVNKSVIPVSFVLNGKKYFWKAGDEVEVEDKLVKFVLSFNSTLVVKEVVISGKAEEIKETKNVKKNKKSK